MNIALWAIAALLALVFLGSGVTKLIQSREKLVASRVGAALEGFSPGAIKAIGAVEVLAAVGLILPAALGIAPVLVPLAAVGVVLLMAGAIITHLRRHEGQAMAASLVLLALAAIVVWGRFGPQAFSEVI